MTTAGDIAQFLEAKLTGNPSLTIAGICAEQSPQAQYLLVASKPASVDKAIAACCSLIIGQFPAPNTLPDSSAYLQVQDSQLAFTRLLAFFAPKQTLPPERHPSAVIHPSSQVDESARIGPHVFIGPGCIIGAGAHIRANVSISANVQIGNDFECFPQVTIYPGTIIGDRVRLHAGVVIGCDGFGYHFANGAHQKQVHLGCAVIEDDVEIGANTAIDRATLGETRIGAGTKIDNHVQIAHNVTLGRCNIVCAFTGIAGSVTSGDYVTFAADVGIADHVTIGDRVTLGARTGIAPNKRLPEGTTWLGNPGRLRDKAVAQALVASRLPELRQKVLNLQTALEEIKAQLSARET